MNHSNSDNLKEQIHDILNKHNDMYGYYDFEPATDQILALIKEECNKARVDMLNNLFGRATIALIKHAPSYELLDKIFLVKGDIKDRLDELNKESK